MHTTSPHLIKRKAKRFLTQTCIALSLTGGYMAFSYAQTAENPSQEQTQAELSSSNTRTLAPGREAISAEDLIARGHYLTTAANCYSCHTSDDNRPYAGGSALITPLGTFYPSNITPDINTGIGTWTDDEFYRALHLGIGREGENLYPVMPYDAYTLLTREDVLAIKAYLFSLPPVHQLNRTHQLQFPYSYRWLMKGWNLLNFHSGPFKPNPAKSDEINQGAYIATALGHCSTCHTPRTITMATETNRSLAGSAITNGWYAPNITPDEFSGIGRWTNAEINQYFRTGSVPGKAAASGPMNRVITHSLSQLEEEDLNDLIAWLRDQTPIRNAAEQSNNARSRFEWGQAQNFLNDIRQTLPYDAISDTKSINAMPRAAQIYYGACASCHGADGRGNMQANFPSLVNKTSLGSAYPNNVIMTILYGVDRKIGNQHTFMPAFNDRLSDEDITLLTNWLFTQYGRPSTSTTVEYVHNMRMSVPVGDTPIIRIIKASGIAIMSLGIIFVLGWIVRLSPHIKAFIAGLRRKRKASSKTASAKTTMFAQTKLMPKDTTNKPLK